MKRSIEGIIQYKKIYLIDIIKININMKYVENH